MGAHCDPLSRSFRLETNPYKSALQGQSSHSLSQTSRDDAVRQEKSDAWIIDKVSRAQRRCYNISCIRYFGETPDAESCHALVRFTLDVGNARCVIRCIPRAGRHRPPRWLPGFRGERKLVGSAWVEPGDPHRTLHPVQSCICEKNEERKTFAVFADERVRVDRRVVRLDPSMAPLWSRL